MFSRRRTEDVDTTYEERSTTVAPVESRSATVARGGVSLWSVLTGVLVAFGVLFLLSAIAGAIIVNTGIEEDIAAGNTVEVGVGAVAALAIVTFLSYLWGGYTAGRMARGSGFANGLLVPIVALVVLGITYAIARGLGETTTLNLPFVENRLPLENDALIDFGVAGGIATLVAMFLGGIIGGLFGSRWHTKLERRALADHDAKTIDLREGRTTQHTAPATATTTTAPANPSTATTSDGASFDHREPVHTRPAGETSRPSSTP